MPEPVQPPLGPAAFQAETGASEAQMAALGAYGATLEKWQKTINLVASGTLKDLWRRHFLDSAQLAPLLPPAPAGRPGVLVDLGSGGGFPGLVLAALLDPACWQVHLVESDGRKCAFLLEAARQMGLEVGKSLAVHRSRIEKMAPIPADVVTSRALAPLDSLLELAEPFRAPGGVCLFLKGITWREELTEAEKRWKLKATPMESRTDSQARVLRIEEWHRRG